jgi:hypothetical protein
MDQIVPQSIVLHLIESQYPHTTDQAHDSLNAHTTTLEGHKKRTLLGPTQATPDFWLYFSTLFLDFIGRENYNVFYFVFVFEILYFKTIKIKKRFLLTLVDIRNLEGTVCHRHSDPLLPSRIITERLASPLRC